ncbi:MAG: hypothetical protein HYW77_03260 [Parcubacteria group bacterium]|nr:hypothetical protein [Parcubacteria group bacterium]
MNREAKSIDTPPKKLPEDIDKFSEKQLWSLAEKTQLATTEAIEFGRTIMNLAQVKMNKKLKNGNEQNLYRWILELPNHKTKEFSLTLEAEPNNKLMKIEIKVDDKIIFYQDEIHESEFKDRWLQGSKDQIN